MKPPPLTAQLEDRQRRQPRERLCDIDRRFVPVSSFAKRPICQSSGSMMAAKQAIEHLPHEAHRPLSSVKIDPKEFLDACSH
jgi:hypothetical protein